MPGAYVMKGKVMHYDWGGYQFIPSLLDIKNPEQKPFAEYWLGTHSIAPSTIVVDGREELLSTKAGNLPYLLKLLDVRDMLSIQVHPTREAATREFNRENEQGVPLDSPSRNYRDSNHKPEMMVALSDFWLLHGFKSTEDLIYTLLNVVELRELLPVFNEKGYEGLYSYIMRMPQEEINKLLAPLVKNVLSIHTNERQEGVDEDYWAGKAALKFAQGENIDRGIISIYLFNLVHLRKGEAIYQSPGVPHAYLEGQNVEIMAASDNVLRGGLTTKQVNVEELLKHVKMEATYPEILLAEPGSNGEIRYKKEVPDFDLCSIQLSGSLENSFAPFDKIILLTEGEAELETTANRLILKQGSPAAFIEAGTEYQLRGNAALFVASQGFPQPV
jgi:mannose-6-phosphate isomerase